MANTPAFSTQAFTRLYVSHAGDIWFGAKNGMIYQYRDGLFIEHDALFSGHEGWINDFAEDAHGRLWVSENRGNLAYFDGQSWTLHPQRIREQFSPLVADANKRIWTYLPGPSPAPPDFIHFRDRIPARLDSVGFLPQASPETIGFSESNNGPIFHRPQGSILSYRREGRIRMDLLDAESTLLGWYWHTPTALASLIDSHGRVWTRHNSQQGNESILRVHKDGQLLAQIQPEGIADAASVFEAAHDVGRAAAGGDTDQHIAIGELNIFQIFNREIGAILRTFNRRRECGITAGDDADNLRGICIKRGRAFNRIQYAQSAGGAGADINQSAAPLQSVGDHVDGLGDRVGLLGHRARHFGVFGIDQPNNL
jgi:hypothetical protein